MKELEPHQLRCIDEAVELEEKLKALTSFLYSKDGEDLVPLNSHHRDLMWEQTGHMESYLKVLKCRIGEFFMEANKA